MCLLAPAHPALLSPAQPSQSHTSMIQFMVVLLILHSQVGLASQGAKCQQPRAAACHWGNPRRLEARRVGWQLDRGTMRGMGEVLCLELLLLQ